MFDHELDNTERHSMMDGLFRDYVRGEISLEEYNKRCDELSED